MQVIQNPNIITGQSSVALTTVSNYIKLFSVPCRSSVHFNISAVISADHFAISGDIVSTWNTASMTATVSEETAGINGVYALRADMPTHGGDVTFWLVFGDNVSNPLEVQTVLTYASVVDEPVIFDMVLSSAPTSVVADLPVRNADNQNVWGSTAKQLTAVTILDTGTTSRADNLWVGTQAEYDALAPDADTLYGII